MDGFWIFLGTAIALAAAIIYRPFDKQLEWLFDRIMPKDDA